MFSSGLPLWGGPWVPDFGLQTVGSPKRWNLKWDKGRQGRVTGQPAKGLQWVGAKVRVRESPCRWTPGLGEAAGGTAGPHSLWGAKERHSAHLTGGEQRGGSCRQQRPCHVSPEAPVGPARSWNLGPSGRKSALSSTPCCLPPGLGSPLPQELPMVGQLSWEEALPMWWDLRLETGAGGYNRHLEEKSENLNIDYILWDK